jgi:hypothetical protein
VHTRCPANGGRGGAVATALAFVVLFLRPDYGLWLLKQRREKMKPNLPEVERVGSELTALVESLEINSKGQKNQNIALAVASGIGTTFFGDSAIFSQSGSCSALGGLVVTNLVFEDYETDSQTPGRKRACVAAELR